MTSIDELFQKSGIPSKRKLEALDPTELYKSAKLSASGSRHARVDDENDAEAGPQPPEDADDADYGPSLPAGVDDEDAAAEEDTEGRFFGGGISRTEREVLDYLDTAATSAAGNSLPFDPDEPIDAAWLKKTALAFEKKINRNAEQRARFESEPARFIDSEADLDAAIRALSILADHPSLYPLFARLGSAASLVSLLAHDNTDIALGAVGIIGELTDEDVPASDEDWSALVDAMIEADLLGLLASHLTRLNETDDPNLPDDDHAVDREGVYRALGVLENLCSRPETAETVGAHDELLRWLLARASRPEQPVGQNKQYAAEVLSILVQSSTPNRRRLASLDAVDAMLQLVAPYRRRDPDKGSDEEEYMENLFAALSSVVDEPEGKAKFVEAEGVELCLLILKDGGKRSRPPALRLLDHAVTGPESLAVCQRVVEAGGLKTTFTLFMKKSGHHPTAEHLLGIFAALLRRLPGESAERIRTLAKFVEKDYEKTARLVKLRGEYAARVAAADARIRRAQEGLDEEEREERAAEWLSQRLDAGLFCLQTIDVILAWLVAEDDGAKGKIKELLAKKGEGFAVLKGTIQEQIDEMDLESEEGNDSCEMLKTLARFLE
ncbi:hypothetical protein VTJ83DRAFT_7567 [Remersonia thermophila]|uniref:Beta-catenin-like protein 1 N-terminal domain-containing protein n=1 Tax=Remersonia thermophila TaxID=72144 RepID=A0ABR4D3W0_9PEZI